MENSTKDLLSQLQQEPYRFDFFQTVRLLQWLAAREHRASANDPVQVPSHERSAAPAPRGSLGHDYAPADEIVRLRAAASLQFPQGAIADFARTNSEQKERRQLVVGFFGLFGPHGVLPRHYTQMVIDRVKAKDPTLRDFLDLFNHRLLSQFYRAWAKYRLPIAFEESVLSGEALGEDRISRCIYSLVGMGTSGLRGRHDFADPVLLYYAGHFAHQPRNASSLQRMIADYFQLPVELRQFQGQWLYLDEDDQSRTGKSPLAGSLNNQLGLNVVVGRRVWSIENRFRIRLGPLNYAEFHRHMPQGNTESRTIHSDVRRCGVRFRYPTGFTSR
jgi:type VI secretion system protein ImpH